MAQSEKNDNIVAQKNEPKIRAKYNPKGKEKDVLHRIYTRYEQMKNAPSRTRFSKDWDRWEKNWEAYRPVKSDDDWQSNIVPPLTTSIVESIIAEMVSQRIRPIIAPRGREDVPGSKIMQNTVDYTCDIGFFDDEMEKVYRQAVKLGTAVTQEYVYEEIRDVQFAKAVADKDKPDEFFDTQRLVEFDDPYMELVKLTEFFVDETARGFRGPYQARDAIRRYIMNYDAFRQFFQGRWDPMDNAKYVKPGGDTNYYEYYEPPSGISHDKQVEVLWYWAKKPDDALIIAANDVVMRMSPNPYNHKQLPFARAVDIKRTHQFYGKGDVELLDSIQEELTLNRRMRLDRSHLQTDQMFLLSDRVSLDEEELIARPHGGIRVPDPQRDIEPLSYPDTPRSAYLEEDRLKEDAVRVTGVDDRVQAADVSGGTATEAAILKEATLKRVNMKLENVKRSFMVEWGRLRVANILQYYTQPKLEAIVGEKNSEKYRKRIEKAQNRGAFIFKNGKPFEKKFPTIRLKDKELVRKKDGGVEEQKAKGFTFFEIKPEDIIPVHGSYDVRYQAGSTLPISKPLRRQELANLYDRISPIAIQGIGGYDPGKLVDMLVEEYDQDPDALKSAEKVTEEDRNATLIRLALTENKRLEAGENIPPTPYASPEHTSIHMDKFEELDILPSDEQFPIWTRHITGELQAQKFRQRAGGGQQQPQPGRRPKAAEAGLSETLPGRVEGGADVAEKLPVPKGGPQFIRKGAQVLSKIFGGEE